MDKILDKIKILETLLGRNLIYFKLYSDSSGSFCYFDAPFEDTEIFEFDNLEELDERYKEYLIKDVEE